MPCHLAEVCLSIPFSRSTRSLTLDSFRPTMIGLALAGLTLLALIIWFFFARIGLFQSSTSAVLQADDQIIASFPAEVFDQLKPGQQATLKLGLNGDQKPATIPAVVFDTQGGSEAVILVITDFSAVPPARSEDLSGRVDVQTEAIHPLELLLRASGKFLNRGSQSPDSQQPSETPQP